MKYLVMECHLSYAVVLDEDGRFLRVANRHYQVGQTVTEVMEMRLPEAAPQRKTANKWMVSLAAAAACLTLAVTSIFQMARTPYASVYMSINPEVRIDVNRKDVVVGLDGVNADGDALITDYSYQRKPLNDVMDELADRAIGMGYLHQGGQITLTLDAGDGQWVAEKSRSLGASLQEHLMEKISVTIEIGNMNDSSHEVIIPVGPGAAAPENDYGEEDYGSVSAPVPTPGPVPGPVFIPIPDSGQDPPLQPGGTSYRDDGQADYGAPDDGQPAAGTSGGDSGYGTSGGDSGYGTSGGDSNYGTSGGDSGYGTSAGDSNYGTSGGDSGYGTSGGDSGYGTSGYGDGGDGSD